MRNRQFSFHWEQIFSQIGCYRIIVPLALSLTFVSSSSVASNLMPDNKALHIGALPNNVKRITIAVVNVRYLMENAPQAAVERRLLRERFKSTERRLGQEAIEIRNLEVTLKKNSDRLSEKEKLARERELRSLRRRHLRGKDDFREDHRIAQMTALEKVQNAVFSAIRKIREQEHIDIILNDFVSASERVNITQHVYQYLEAQLRRDNLLKEEANKNKE